MTTRLYARRNMTYTVFCHPRARFECKQRSLVYMGLCLNYETYSFYIAPCNGLLGPLAQYAANHVVGIYKKNNVPEFPT